LALLAMGGALLAACGITPRAPGPPVLGTAPEFSLKDERGRVVTLADLTQRGPALIVFYRGYW
jgi:hypothetical protein